MRILWAGFSAIVVIAALASGPAMADGDGEKVFKKCKTCHSLKAGDNKVGPSLAGVAGRTAGTAEGYTKYSDAMIASGVVWDDATLDQYLADPKGFIPGNKMSFTGLKKAEDRAAVIAYLKEAHD